MLKKELMSKDINETDHFVYNSSFHSKFYKVKIGTVSAQKETEPEKQETRQKVPTLTSMFFTVLNTWRGGRGCSKCSSQS